MFFKYFLIRYLYELFIVLVFVMGYIINISVKRGINVDSLVIES